MTLRVYAHVLEQADQEVAAALARTLDTTGASPSEPMT
jgi:hypothetical protein